MGRQVRDASTTASRSESNSEKRRRRRRKTSRRNKVNIAQKTTAAATSKTPTQAKTKSVESKSPSKEKASKKPAKMPTSNTQSTKSLHPKVKESKSKADVKVDVSKKSKPVSPTPTTPTSSSPNNNNNNTFSMWFRRKNTRVSKETFSESTKGKKVKRKHWIGEHVADKLFKNFSWDRVCEEFEQIDEFEVKDELCAAFLDNMNKNRSEEIECLDTNRVLLEKSRPEHSEYIHASRIDIKNFPRLVILAQLPIPGVLGAVEDFWRMVHQEKATTLRILCTSSDSKNGFDEFFPIKSANHRYYGTMFVNNRRTEKSSGADQHVNISHLEVLPEGCSEAVMSRVMIDDYWPDKKIPKNFRYVLNAVDDIISNPLESDTVILSSLYGAGRTGTFLAIAVVITYLSQGLDVNIKDIVDNIRKQRPGAVDTLNQYAFVYLTTFRYIQLKASNQQQSERATEFMKTYNDNEVIKNETIEA